MILKLQPTSFKGPTIFLRDKAWSEEETILIQIFESLITSFLLLGKKSLRLLLINLQSCVQLSTQSLRKVLTVH